MASSTIHASLNRLKHIGTAYGHECDYVHTCRISESHANMTPNIKSGGKKKKRDTLHSHEHSHMEPLK